MAEPEDDLVRRAQAGEEAALVALVQEHQRYVYSIALSIMRNPQDAADMTQESFIRLLRSLPSYRGETKFTTWLYRLVTNICLDGLRRRRKGVVSLDEAADGGRPLADDVPDLDRWNQPEEQATARETAVTMREAVDELPPAQRLALTLYYFEEHSYEAIAEKMGLPLNTVKSHIRRGKERLAQRVRKDEARMGGLLWSVAT